jgi:hypothetical protein
VIFREAFGVALTPSLSHLIAPGCSWDMGRKSHLTALFVWLISHQPTLLFSQNKPAISNQPAILFSQKNQHQHQPNEQAGASLRTFHGGRSTTALMKKTDILSAFW